MMERMHVQIKRHKAHCSGNKKVAKDRACNTNVAKTQRDRARKVNVARLSLQQQGCKDWRNHAGNNDVEHTAANVVIIIIIIVVVVIVGPCHSNHKA